MWPTLGTIWFWLSIFPATCNCQQTDFVFGTDYIYGVRNVPEAPYPPESWGLQPDFQCDVNTQSPIALSLSNTNHSLHCLNPLINYDDDDSFQITNDRSSLTINTNIASRHQVSSVPTGYAQNTNDNLNCGEKNYFLNAAIIRLGYDNTGDPNKGGTEHMVDGSFGVMEIQFNHFDEVYLNYENATLASEPGSRMIICVLFELSTDDNPALSPIVDSLAETLRPGQSREISLSISDLLPKESDRKQYYLYDGSQSFPACRSNVRYLVFKSRSFVSSSQLDTFKTLTTGVAEQPLVFPNVRPIQPISNSTYVYANGFSSTGTFQKNALPGYILGGLYFLILITLEFILSIQYYMKKERQYPINQ